MLTVKLKNIERLDKILEMLKETNSDFGLVTQTPGVGGGMAPYRSNLIRAGVSSGAKQYYKIFKANPQRSPIMLKDIMFK